MVWFDGSDSMENRSKETTNAAVAMRDQIIGLLTSLVAADGGNWHEVLAGPFFGPPLIGFAAADDPLFETYRSVIGDFHLTPRQWLKEAGGAEATGGTVISWILPISEATRISNRAEKLEPSHAWAVTRNNGEVFNNLLRQRLETFLREQGAVAVAPVCHSSWRTLHDPRVGAASNWSERHAAFAAGLGTFSLNDGLITAAGIAHRCGSVITSLRLPVSERPYQGIHDYCLHYAKNTCGACVSRCPVNAITRGDGHDKGACQSYTYGELQPRLKRRYDVAICGCGLCQTKIPCEFRNPTAS